VTTVVSYGTTGRPLLLFPTAAGDPFDNENFGLVKALEPFLLSGRLRVFSIDTINRRAWMNPDAAVEEQARLQSLYSRFVEEEVVPFIRSAAGDDGLRVTAAGASFGAFHAANALFRRPDLFETLVAMSGFYDLAPHYLRGYSDDDCYYNNPPWYLPRLEGKYLDLLRDATSIYLVSGRGPYEMPDASFGLSSILSSKGIPHTLDIWGTDVSHEWIWWRKMIAHAATKLGW
jgi:esterase/lipase superfamily enzyme